MKIKVLFILFLIVLYSCNSKEEQIARNEYRLHLEDLKNIESKGYKHNFSGIDTQGTVQVTGNPLECAILGSGFFKFVNPDTNQVLYSRNGTFSFSESGCIINNDGFRLEPKVSCSSCIPIQSLSIDESGNVLRNEQGRIDFIGKIYVYARTDNSYLKEGNYYSFESAKETESRIISGALETCNYSIQAKLYSLMEILYQLKSLDSKRSEYYSFRIKLVEELFSSYQRLNYLETILQSSDNFEGKAVFYHEVNETIEFLEIQPPGNI